MGMEGTLGKLIRKDDKKKAFEDVTGKALKHGEEVSEEEKLSTILSPEGDPEKRTVAGLLIAKMLTPGEQKTLFDSYKEKKVLDPALRKKVSLVGLELSQRLPVFEAAKNIFDSKEILHMAALDPKGFGMIAGDIEEGNLKERIDMFFARLAANDISRLSRMVEIKRGVNERMESKEFKNLQADVDWSIKTSGMSEDKLELAINPADRAGSEKKIEESVREQITGFHKVTNWLKNTTGLGWGSERAARRIFDLRVGIDRNRSVMDIRNNMAIVGRMLKFTINKDPQFRAAMDIESISGEGFTHEKLEPVTSFANVVERNRSVKEAADKAIRERFMRDANKVTKDLFGRNRNYYSLRTDAEKDQVRNKILDNMELDRTFEGIESAHRQSGSGVFAQVLASFISVLFGTPLGATATPVPGGYRSDMRTVMPDDLIQRPPPKKRR